MTEATTTTEATTRRTTGKGSTAPSTFGKLWALAHKGSKKQFTLSRKTDEGGAALKLDGAPSALSADAIRELALKNGGIYNVKGDIGESTGAVRVVKSAAEAAEAVEVMVNG
jgi:hypothetical protein